MLVIIDVTNLNRGVQQEDPRVGHGTFVKAPY